MNIDAKRTWFLPVVMILPLLLILFLRVQGRAAQGDTTRVSVDSLGEELDGHSWQPSISSDGRYVAFASLSALEADDTNNANDVFVHDRVTGKTTYVSVSSSGEKGNGNSSSPLISSTGRYVAFASEASNLVAEDTNLSVQDVFVHDRDADGNDIFDEPGPGATTTELVSVSSAGEQGNVYALGSSISPDGRYVAFYSKANNLVDDDTNNQWDAFVHDRITGETVRVSISSAGEQGDAYSGEPSLSSDGRYVAFESYATNFPPHTSSMIQVDIFVHDRDADGNGVFDEPGQVSTECVSVSPSGEASNLGGHSPAISSDGRYVVFVSRSDNLIPNDTDDGIDDILIHDRDTGETARISEDSPDVQGDGHSYEPSISSNNRYVAFHSQASNLVFGDTNGADDVFVHDRIDHETTRVSVSSSGEQTVLGVAANASISSEGHFVAFHSNAPNLVADDTNGFYDVFVHEYLGTAEIAYYCDDDGDNYIDSSRDGTCATSGCEPAGCETVPGGDCNDTDPAVNPGATEVCNTTDDNCNGATDEGFDADSDTYTTCSGDCDDGDPEVNPGATEFCNEIDDNCNGEIDEDCVPVPQPDIDVLPVSVDFGDVAVGSSSNRDISISNVGTAVLTITNIELTGDPSFSPMHDCATVDRGSSCTVTVTFFPLTSGLKSSNLTITSDDPDEPSVDISINGNAFLPAPDISVLPLSIDFSNVAVDSNATRQLSVTNEGTAGLIITAIDISGDPDFSYFSGCPADPEPLEPSDTCSVTVEFAPSSEGTKSASLTVESNDPDTPIVDISLSGTGTVPEIDVSTTSLNFHNVLVGTALDLEIEIVNAGLADLIMSISITGSQDFALTNACEFVPPGYACRITVTFTPSSLGSKTATLTIYSNDPDEPAVDVSLLGNGIIPDIDVSPLSVDFGEVLVNESAGESIRVHNIGTADLAVMNITLTGPPDFSELNDCAKVLPDESCWIAATFTPSTEGVQNGVIVIESDDPDSPVTTVSLSGTGIALPPADIDVNPASIDMGNVSVGSFRNRDVTVTNAGSASLTIASIGVTGAPEWSQSNNCESAPLGSGSSCSVTVTFSPSSEGFQAATLTIPSDDPDEPVVEIPLAGNGVAGMEISVWHIETLDSVGSVGWFPSIALNSSGHPHITYVDKTGDNILHASREETGWTLQILDVGNNVTIKGQATSTAVDSYDFVHASYFETNNADLNYASFDGGWSIETVESDGVVGAFSSIAVDVWGHPHISYVNDTDNELKYAYLDGTGWHLETVDSQSGAYMDTSIGLDSAELPHIIYTDWLAMELRHAYRDGNGWVVEAIDSGGYFRAATAIDSWGVIHVAYTDADWALRYARNDGSEWTTKTVEEGYGGLISSMAVDAAGHPHISYHGGGSFGANGILKYAHRDETSWNIETVDSSAYVGYHAGIALDALGNPHIGYLDQTNADLKYASRYEISISEASTLFTPGGDVGISISAGSFSDEFPPEVIAEPEGIPEGFLTPYGGIGFTLLTEPGETVTIILVFPEALLPGSVLLKCREGACTEILGMTISGNQVIYEATEGGALDEDDAENGRLVEPCVLAVPEFEPATEVLVDIKPGSYPNSVNKASKGNIAAAILGSSVDVSRIDPNTIKIDDNDAPDTGVSPIKSSFEDVDGDNLTDCVFHFSTEALNEAGLLVDDQVLHVTARLSDGTTIHGSDTIRLVAWPR